VSTPTGNKLTVITVPALLIITAYFAMPHASALPATLVAKLPLAPYLMFAGAAALGILYDRHRMVLTSLALAVSYWILSGSVSENFRVDQHAQLLYCVVGLLLPINLALICGQKESKPLSIEGIIAFSVIACQVAIAFLLVKTYPELIRSIALFEVLPNVELNNSLQIPQMIFLCYLLATGYAVCKFLEKKSVFESAFIGCLIASGLFFHTGLEYPNAALYMTLAGFIPIVAIVQNAYFIAYMDELTDLPGRRALNEEMARLRGNYSIAMLDVDHFKKFNDTYGHDIGDQVLRMVGSKIRGIGGGGKPYRYGGEEFAILFPNKSTKTSFPHLSNLREEIDGTRMVLRNQSKTADAKIKKKPKKKITPWQEVHVTISIGVAERSKSLIEAMDVIKGADQALYHAKGKGRNRISQYAA